MVQDFTYDLTTDRGKVRLLVFDFDESDPENQIYTDNEIDTFLTLENSDVRLAAAQALDVIASREVLIQKVIKTQDGFQTDGAKVAAEIRQRAKSLREQVTDGLSDPAGIFEIAEQILDPFTQREFWRKDSLRNQ